MNGWGTRNLIKKRKKKIVFLLKENQLFFKKLWLIVFFDWEKVMKNTLLILLGIPAPDDEKARAPRIVFSKWVFFCFSVKKNLKKQNSQRKNFFSFINFPLHQKKLWEQIVYWGRT